MDKLTTYANPTAEPSRLVAAITGVIMALFALLVALNLPITPEVQVAVVALITAVAGAIPIVQGELTRKRVTSPQSAEAILKAAYEAGQKGEAVPTMEQALQGPRTAD